MDWFNDSLRRSRAENGHLLEADQAALRNWSDPQAEGIEQTFQTLAIPIIPDIENAGVWLLRTDPGLVNAVLVGDSLSLLMGLDCAERSDQSEDALFFRRLLEGNRIGDSAGFALGLDDELLIRGRVSLPADPLELQAVLSGIFVCAHEYNCLASGRWRSSLTHQWHIESRANKRRRAAAKSSKPPLLSGRIVDV
jgi:hypothetical protein